MRYLVGILFMAVVGLAQATQLQGVGSFQILNEPVFVVGLFAQDNRFAAGQKQQNEAAVAEKLEFKVVDDKISIRRYRQLWQDVFAVAQGRDVWDAHSADLQTFFQVIKGPLVNNDQIVLERKDSATIVSVNYRQHAVLSAEFLDLMVSTLTARIAPVPELRAGLLGELPADESNDLLRQFDRSEPTLGRISQTARWLRIKEDDEPQVSQL
ncbi:MAG: hypothetical protein CMI08_15605 [Oceanospirillaceae bacterium]|uniref:hypothetical protein n=1 Tax=unclassified Thalassolituus TaxID=2624967 RepID=UPI000C0AE483|nr:MULTISPECIES: hypothetical protein [unclassified Thalassolituus]MAK90977.1 hypothetical protein [Thalassolituus sp.]MAS25897.1 hypothetical protein [Oceanospirillaceae bacterium]MAY00593.1 hypothetical protein [Oceanospirillaceae bacterium]MBL35283.1 hypothetical protein [Oceanospirillaceae bacterium]MBS54622.1 hypothetical protein [Oceanospirillaceae bacterium]|tara:strand:- start:253 stop:885 length:633 start_codon:yes stop_codon:yes gene_type:complete